MLTITNLRNINHLFSLALKTTLSFFDHNNLRNAICPWRWRNKCIFGAMITSSYLKTNINIDNACESNAKSEAADWRPKSMIGNTQKHLQKVADIPAPIYYELIEKFGQPRDNPKAWKRWLNDYDNRFFRTTGGTI